MKIINLKLILVLCVAIMTVSCGSDSASDSEEKQIEKRVSPIAVDKYQKLSRDLSQVDVSFLNAGFTMNLTDKEAISQINNLIDFGGEMIPEDSQCEEIAIIVGNNSNLKTQFQMKVKDYQTCKYIDIHTEINSPYPAYRNKLSAYGENWLKNVINRAEKMKKERGME